MLGVEVCVGLERQQSLTTIRVDVLLNTSVSVSEFEKLPLFEHDVYVAWVNDKMQIELEITLRQVGLELLMIHFEQKVCSDQHLITLIVTGALRA